MQYARDISTRPQHITPSILVLWLACSMMSSVILHGSDFISAALFECPLFLPPMAKRPFADISNQLLPSDEDVSDAEPIHCTCRTRDGHAVKVPMETVRLCPMLRNFMGADFDSAEEIPLATISRDTFQDIVTYLNLSSSMPARRGPIIANPPQENTQLEALGFAAWEATWIRGFNTSLTQLVQAADFLALHSLLELCVAQTRLLMATPTEPPRMPTVQLPIASFDPIADDSLSPPRTARQSKDAAPTLAVSSTATQSSRTEAVKKLPEEPFLQTSCSKTSLLPYLCRGKKFLGLCTICQTPLRGNHSGYCPSCSARR